MNRFAPQSIAMSQVCKLTLLSQLLWSSAWWVDGLLIFEHTSVLKLTLQLWNSIESGNFPRCISEIWNLGIIHHTIERISSTSVTVRFQGCRALLKTWSWYCRTLRLSYSSSSMFHNISCSRLSQSAWRWCQIPWKFEGISGWPFWSR